MPAHETPPPMGPVLEPADRVLGVLRPLAVLVVKASWLAACAYMCGIGWLVLHVEPWGAQTACSRRLVDPYAAFAACVLVIAAVGIVRAAVHGVAEAWRPGTRPSPPRWPVFALVLATLAPLGSWATFSVCFACGDAPRGPLCFSGEPRDDGP